LLHGGASKREVAATAFGARGKLVFQNELGEYTLRSLLKLGLPMPQAVRVAQGWSGDRLRLYQESDGNLAAHWTIVFATEQGARDFLDGLGEYLRLRYGIAIMPAVCLWRAEDPAGLTVTAQRRGRVVDVAFKRRIVGVGYTGKSKL
jgi:hypothetical protein